MKALCGTTLVAPPKRRSHLMPGLPDFFKPVLTRRRDNGCLPSAFTRAPKGLSGGSSEVIVPPALIALPRTNRQFSERSAQGTFPLHCFCVLNCRCDHYSTVCAVVKQFCSIILYNSATLSLHLFVHSILCIRAFFCYNTTIKEKSAAPGPLLPVRGRKK